MFPSGQKEKIALRCIRPGCAQVLFQPDTEVDIFVVKPITNPDEKYFRILFARDLSCEGEQVRPLAPLRMTRTIDHPTVAAINPGQLRYMRARVFKFGGADPLK